MTLRTAENLGTVTPTLRVLLGPSLTKFASDTEVRVCSLPSEHDALTLSAAFLTSSGQSLLPSAALNFSGR